LRSLIAQGWDRINSTAPGGWGQTHRRASLLAKNFLFKIHTEKLKLSHERLIPGAPISDEPLKHAPNTRQTRAKSRQNAPIKHQNGAKMRQKQPL
jgi:hypothetical protein